MRGCHLRLSAGLVGRDMRQPERGSEVGDIQCFGFPGSDCRVEGATRLGDAARPTQDVTKPAVEKKIYLHENEPSA